MERLGWRSSRAFKLVAMRKTGRGWPVCSQTTICHVLKKIELNRRFIQFNLKSIFAYGIMKETKEV